MFSFFLLLKLTSEFLLDVKSRIFDYFACVQLNSFVLAYAREVESKYHQIELMGQDYKKKESHNLLRKIEDFGSWQDNDWRRELLLQQMIFSNYVLR